jgi:hypothetical protein
MTPEQIAGLMFFAVIMSLVACAAWRTPGAGE